MASEQVILLAVAQKIYEAQQHLAEYVSLPGTDYYLEHARMAVGCLHEALALLKPDTAAC